MTSRAEIMDAWEQAVALQQQEGADPETVAEAFQRWEDLNDQWEQENGTDQ